MKYLFSIIVVFINLEIFAQELSINYYAEQNKEEIDKHIEFIRSKYSYINAKKDKFTIYHRLSVKNIQAKKFSSFKENNPTVIAELAKLQLIYTDPNSPELYQEFIHGTDTLFHYKLVPTKFYYEGTSLRLIEYKSSSDYDTEKREYYFWDNQLIFAFLVSGGREHPALGNKKTLTQKRLYFRNESPIRVLLKNYEGEEDAFEKIDSQPNTNIELKSGLEILDEVNELVRITNNKI